MYVFSLYLNSSFFGFFGVAQSGSPRHRSLLLWLSDHSLEALFYLARKLRVSNEGILNPADITIAGAFSNSILACENMYGIFSNTLKKRSCIHRVFGFAPRDFFCISASFRTVIILVKTFRVMPTIYENSLGLSLFSFHISCLIALD